MPKAISTLIWCCWPKLLLTVHTAARRQEVRFISAEVWGLVERESAEPLSRWAHKTQSSSGFSHRAPSKTAALIAARRETAKGRLTPLLSSFKTRSEVFSPSLTALNPQLPEWTPAGASPEESGKELSILEEKYQNC